MSTNFKFVVFASSLLTVSLLLVKATAMCNSNCSVSRSHSTPSLIANVTEAILHSKCYSTCTNQVIGNGSHLNCSTIQKIESCRIGCIISNKEGTKDCTQKCVSTQNKNEGVIDWSIVYSTDYCKQYNNEMYCIAGCLIELNQDVNNGNITDIDSSVIISNPDITYIGSHHHLIYMINMTKPFNSNSSHELRVAMVIEITDTNTSAVHYQWKPSLLIPIDLTYMACHEIILKVKIVYGNLSLPYSSPVKMCVDHLQHCKSVDENINDKVNQIENKLANLLDMIKPFATLTTTKRLDQIEAKLEEIIKVINQQQSP